ncbi:MAG: helix-turn-helix transcriptional regulator [Clostridia bacterium]|nr:helix-turn-helix transcriptional regulator [Clostridia bacterium]
MNQEKIGKFIAQLRKEENMTQVELANRLGITDRAVSKWENGRGLPDLSLIKPLCQILNISINELLSGEKLEKNMQHEEYEKNISKTIDYTNNKIKRTKTIFKITLLSIFLLLLLIITLFSVDVNRMRNNKPVFFSTWGFEYVPPIDLSTEQIENAIYTYLTENNDSEVKHYDNEKWFVSFRTYLIEEKNNKALYNIYAWVLQESYYLENNEIKQGSGSSILHKFVVEVRDGNYVVTDSRIPRDGSLYSEDMKNMFPNSVQKDMANVHTDGTVERLQLEIQKQVSLYFHI